MEAKTKKILLISGGVLALAGIGFMVYRNRQNNRLANDLGRDMNALTAEEVQLIADSQLNKNMDTPIQRPSAPSDAGFITSATPPPIVPDKKETIEAFKADKSRIKAICGRRIIFNGKRKDAWLQCVAAQGGNANDSYYNFDGDFDGGDNYIEVGYQITDLD